MPPPPNIYLIGPMGSGKTAVGRRLAHLLGREFLDSDAEIEKRTGVDVRYIFEKEGEERFRLREREVIADLTALRLADYLVSPLLAGLTWMLTAKFGD